MPLPNEHAARLRNPSGFVSIRQIWKSGGVRALGGRLKSKPRGGMVEQSIRFDKKKYSYLDTTRDYDYTPKFRWMRDNLPYASLFMSWDRLSGPYGRGTPESVKAMYNDRAVLNRDEINCL